MDNGHAIIGATGLINNNTPSGVAYVFELSGGTWTEVKAISGGGIPISTYQISHGLSYTVQAENFAFAVAMDGNNTNAIIGSHYTDSTWQTDVGAAYIFTIT